MTAVGHHLVLRLSDDRLIASTAEARCVLTRVVLEIGRQFALLAFRAVDCDVFLVAAGDRRGAGELARRVEIALQQRLIGGEVGFDPARIRPIADPERLLSGFHHLLGRMPSEAPDPYHDASNLPDLLGLRLFGAHTVARVRARLPMVRRSQLMEHLGVARLDPDVPLDPDGLVPATLAAATLTELKGRTREVADARAAAVRVADEALTTARIAQLLAVDGRTVRRLRNRSVDDRLIKAIKLQLALRRAVDGKSWV